MESPHKLEATTPRQFLAVAFDFDGTLVDTLHLHYEAYRRVFERLGIELSHDDFFGNIGGTAKEAIPLFLRGRQSPLSISEIHNSKKKVITTLFAHAPLQVLPAARFLKIFAGLVPMALVSSGAKDGVIQLLVRLGWLSYFDVIVTGEDTPRGKPDPMPYLLAAEKLGISPADMAAFEDTIIGLESARKAGCPVFDVSQNAA